MAIRSAAHRFAFDEFPSDKDARPRMSPTAVRTLAQEVIIRVAAQAKAERVEATAPKISQLCQALLGPDDMAAADIVRDARMSGMCADTLYHGLVAGAVKEIGTAWEDDQIAMLAVLRASTRVWRILCDLREVFVQISDRVPGQQAVFVQCPNEPHSLGLTMTADDLRRRGWEIDVLTGYDHDSVVHKLEHMAPTTVAIAATTAELTLSMARLVVALRAHLPGVWILVGGQITTAEPQILALTGADAKANSADEAEALMLAHIGERTSRRVNRA